MADLGQLVERLNCSRAAWRRDECGDWRIEGKNGWIYAYLEGFYIYYKASTSRAYTFGKKEFEFCKMTQDGDDEGVFLLDRLPTKAEAEIILDRVGIRRRRRMTEAGLVALSRARAKSPLRVQKPVTEG